MNVPQEELDRWARFADEVRVKTLNLAARTLEPIREELLRLHTTAARMLSRMELAGAATPEYLPPPSDVPLQLLDTPANRRLARALREAHEAAVEVDKERGHYPDGSAEFLEDMLYRVELELNGPQGLSEGQ